MAGVLNKFAHSYEPHLMIRESSVPPGKEWTPPASGWTMIQVGRGIGYWLQGQSRTELATGAVLLVAKDLEGRLLASQLNTISLHYFTIAPERLTGLMTLGDQDHLNRMAARKESALRIFSPQDPVAMKIIGLFAEPKRSGLSSRLTMLQLLVEASGHDFASPPAGQDITDARDRLRTFLQETQPETLLEIGLDELARTTNCTPRHLSRIFYEVVGMSFRDKRAEIRLARARDLLATSQSKVVEVALESGYKSLSLFNSMFTRRFGISPGRWRQKNKDTIAAANRRQSRPGKPVVNKTRRPVVW